MATATSIASSLGSKNIRDKAAKLLNDTPIAEAFRKQPVVQNQVARQNTQAQQQIGPIASEAYQLPNPAQAFRNQIGEASDQRSRLQNQYGDLQPEALQATGVVPGALNQAQGLEAIQIQEQISEVERQKQIAKDRKETGFEDIFRIGQEPAPSDQQRLDELDIPGVAPEHNIDRQDFIEERYRDIARENLEFAQDRQIRSLDDTPRDRISGESKEQLDTRIANLKSLQAAGKLTARGREALARSYFYYSKRNEGKLHPDKIREQELFTAKANTAKAILQRGKSKAMLDFAQELNKLDSPELIRSVAETHPEGSAERIAAMKRAKELDTWMQKEENKGKSAFDFELERVKKLSSEEQAAHWDARFNIVKEDPGTMSPKVAEQAWQRMQKGFNEWDIASSDEDYSDVPHPLNRWSIFKDRNFKTHPISREEFLAVATGKIVGGFSPKGGKIKETPVTKVFDPKGGAIDPGLINLNPDGSEIDTSGAPVFSDEDISKHFTG